MVIDSRWISHMEQYEVTRIIAGPLLWTLCIVGIVFNAGITICALTTASGSTGLLTIGMSMLLLFRAANMLFMHDEIRGEINGTRE